MNQNRHAEEASVVQRLKTTQIENIVQDITGGTEALPKVIHKYSPIRLSYSTSNKLVQLNNVSIKMLGVC